MENKQGDDDKSQMHVTLTGGTLLSHYRVIEKIGAGGMGEVYRAQDTRLGRDVAIKVLSPHLAVTAEVRARFEREARTISQLNHSHICTLHDIGHQDGMDYLVMELLEGETLANRLAKGPLPVVEVLSLGAQIAEALDVAHRRGIVHRDLKPGNVMLTRAGAKLMDFGLARASVSPVAGAEPDSPTMSRPLTEKGTIVGTFQYMAPEQLEGKEADARSDIWALGCVLYEMATGKPSFEGTSQASLIAAIMEREPRPITELQPLSPPGLDRLVRQCLAKDPDERWQSAGDVRRELEWIAGGSSATAMPVVRQRRRRVPAGALGLAGGGLIAVAALAYALGPWSAHRAETRLVRFSITSSAGAALEAPADAEVSPDGHLLAFIAADSGFIDHIYVRPLASPEARPISGTEGASLPFWSPDGRMLGFFAGGKLRKVALDGSAPVELCNAPDPRGGAWSPGGTIVFAPNNQGGLARVPAKGGVPTPVTQPDTTRRERGHRYPQFLPDGTHFLYVAIGAEEEVSTFAASLDGGKPVEVCRAGSGARYAAPGYLLFLDTGVNSPRRRLLARRFDAGRLRPIGDTELLLDQVSATNFGYLNVTVGGLGTLVAQHWSDQHFRLSWRDRHGAVTGVAIEDIAGVVGPLSPDGQRLAYGGADPQDLFVRDLAAGGVSTRLTFENQGVNFFTWSPDGRCIAFARLSGARGWEVCVKAADGTGPDSLVFRGPGLLSYPQAWSRDGRWLLVLCSDPTGAFDLWRVPMAGDGKPEVYQKTLTREYGGSLSPDGRWLAYTADEGGKPSLYVQSFPYPGAKYQVAVADVGGVSWTDSGDALLVSTSRGDIMEIQVSTVDGFRQGVTTHLFRLPQGDFEVDVERGEQRFLTATPIDLTALTRLEVVLGWPALLEKQ
jgi:WD40 repeat protein